MKLFSAFHEGKYVSGLLGFACGRRVSITTIASDKDAWPMRPNDLVHFELIGWSQRNGYDYFDFGSIRYQGQQQFKKKWGCVLDDDSYYFLEPKKPMRDVATFNTSSPTMTFMAKMWSKWMPPAGARALGPIIRRQLVR